MVRRTAVFKDSWAHKGGRGAMWNHVVLPAKAGKHAVEDVPKLHADFWTMVGDEMRAGYVMKFAA